MTTREIIDICLEGKSLKAKKAWLTREAKNMEERIRDLRVTMKSPIRSRYLHGDFITWKVVWDAEEDLRIIKDLRQTIS